MRIARFTFIAVLVSIATHAFALEPDEIALVCNKNAPASVKLAEFYAKARLIPDGRIIALDLPGTEQLSFDRYERDVIPAIREFLRSHQLEQKVTCLVTFYGVPIRIAARTMTPEDKHELDTLRGEYGASVAKVKQLVESLEKIATDVDAQFKPAADNDVEAFSRRIDAAMLVISRSGSKFTEPQERESVLNQTVLLLEQLNGKPAVLDRLHRSGTTSATQPVTENDMTENRLKLQIAQEQSSELAEKRYDRDARAALRTIVRDVFGASSYARLLRTQVDYFNGDESVAAFDNELALLWWKAYPRHKWLVNPLCYAVRAPHSPPTMMVMRLDGPQEGTARDIIISSLKAEREGLKGKIVVDAGGAAKIDPGHKSSAYWEFEKSLHDWVDLARKAKIPVVLDERADVLPAGAVKNVALYCGWYNLRNYIPACTFNPGAIAIHVASFEMVSIHSDTETGWVHGLLNDGVAATLGPVDEPLLFSFPRPDDFFPLLLTGKLTLAEVYWKSTPMTSWMISMIGDPLYTPYKVNPALAVEDLPSRLQGIFGPISTTQPAIQAPALDGR